MTTAMTTAPWIDVLHVTPKINSSTITDLNPSTSEDFQSSEKKELKSEIKLRTRRPKHQIRRKRAMRRCHEFLHFLVQRPQHSNIQRVTTPPTREWNQRQLLQTTTARVAVEEHTMKHPFTTTSRATTMRHHHAEDTRSGPDHTAFGVKTVPSHVRRTQEIAPTL